MHRHIEDKTGVLQGIDFSSHSFGENWQLHSVYIYFSLVLCYLKLFSIILEMWKDADFPLIKTRDLEFVLIFVDRSEVSIKEGSRVFEQ